ncbi:class I SAM-dependent methyltransferase [Streptomyces sp. HB2AG]|uniref:class I SAM-dependent methyltransferase n=1 Tax=Streptomyces sp. HB2AG TaxID=2983400 RepID=UPI0022AB1730|nr:class I SAM-dependent methyltransferase [Streptomyces sp. HB2AG]MCZ2523486.1 class I SAM-dependent methyltransferase [Streptomyces sp. HB2AG]
MKGQPCLSAGFPEPYAATADTYDRLVAWVIDTWGETPRPLMGEFLHSLWSGRAAPVRNVLEICCGTGLMLHELVRRGYRVTGLDRSASMLEIARARLGDDVPLVRAELPDIPMEETFDAVVCPAAALNYMPDEATLEQTFRAVARRLPPGGPFVFDLLSRTMLESTWGRSVWADDLGDFAFVWEFEHTGNGYSDMTYTQFLNRAGNADGPFTRTRELHRLFVLDRETVRRAAHRAGFEDVEVLDNYTSRPADASTRYETWTLTRG